jgi:acetyl-CoA acetyltransferase
LTFARGKVAIVGVAFSEVVKRSNRSLGQLAVEACLKAIDDAGLRLEDIDGIANYPAPSRISVANPVDGIDIVGVHYIVQALTLEKLRWVCSVMNGTVVASLVEAIHALLAGTCTYALVWRGMHNPPGQFGRLAQPLASGDAQFTAPWGFAHNVVDYSLPYSRYMGKYGATREDMAPFIVRNRANAAKNPNAAFFGQPITREEYMNARMIAEPLSILDCDMPVDGCGALVLTTAERARDLKQKPVLVQGCTALGLPLQPQLLMDFDEFMASAKRVARATWQSSGMSHQEIAQLQLYDGFSYFPYLWLEAFGFYKEGEAYLGLKEDNHSICGRLPVNTGGGALGMGRLHGTPQVIEAVLQIQRRAGPRQVAKPSVALVHAGDSVHIGGALVLSE